MYLAIIVLPLLGSIFSGLFGRKIGVKGSQIITCGTVIITTLLAILAFIEVGLNNVPVYILLFKWIDIESFNIFWGFYFDSLTVSMLIPVLIVSSLVHIYSIGYMENDPHSQRFFSYLNLFTFMMIILVTANNFLLMFVGWEGVGICSYLLVSFWFTRIAANQSSVSAFLTNRVGDCFLTIGMFSLLWSFGNIDYSTIFSLAPYITEKIVIIIGICLLIGAMAKSSQVGLHVWLPMAMEGPTPVSALIHAATMVTAGVYLLIRTSPIIEYSSTVLILCLWLGAITTVFSSLIGLFQQDIKKVIAYSTMSQLGMMVIAIGLSSYNIALFHLVNHAFYKALLFLGAGVVIHAVADNQDFRKYGGLKILLPLTYSVMLIASLSLVAFPYMTGFYSKDFILESTYGQFYFSGIVVYYIATIGAMFTTLYSIKVLYLTFLTNPNGPISNYRNAHEGNIFMSFPLIMLAVFSIFFGYIAKDLFIGLGSGFFEDNSIYIHPINEIMLDTEFAVSRLFKLLPLLLTLSISIIAIFISEILPKIIINFKFSRLGYNIFSFLNQRFLIEFFYNKYITGFILKIGGQTTKVLDKGSIELLGPYGLEKMLIFLSRNITNLDTGIVTSYALYILIGIIFYILIPYISLTSNNILLLILFGLFHTTRNIFIYNPPKPHMYVNINKQSNFDLIILLKLIRYKVFNINNIIAMFITCLIIFIVRLILYYKGYPADISFILVSLFKGIKIIVDSFGDNNDSNSIKMLANKFNDNNPLVKNYNSKDLKDLHVYAMDRDETMSMDSNQLEQLQRMPIIGQANPPNRMNQMKEGMKPIPGSVTSDIEDACYSKEEKLEWIKFFQKKRLELYLENSLFKKINLDLLDKKSHIADHRLKEAIDARQGLEQWRKNKDAFWADAPSYSVRRTQQLCLSQLLSFHNNLGNRPLNLDELMKTALQREEYLELNKKWSHTFDGLHKDQLNNPYFPENIPEEYKTKFLTSPREESPMRGIE